MLRIDMFCAVPQCCRSCVYVHARTEVGAKTLRRLDPIGSRLMRWRRGDIKIDTGIVAQGP